MRFWLLLFSLTFAAHAAAHRFAPSLLEVTQLSETTFSASWKTVSYTHLPLPTILLV